MLRKLSVAIALALVGALVVFGVVYAITITVDGVREVAWDGSGGQTPGIITDTDEISITNGYDIYHFQWTNDQTYMYFLVQTYANTILTGNPAPTVVICLDTDNNSGTGGSYANCNGMTGIDRSIVINRFSVDVYIGDPNTGTLIGGGGTGTRATATDITEVRVSLSDLGFSGTFCPSSITTAVYFDNGITDPDDNVPDSGTTTISCGGPTAVTLNNLEARTAEANNTAALILVATVVVVFGVLGTVTIRRRKQHTL